MKKNKIVAGSLACVLSLATLLGGGAVASADSLPESAPYVYDGADAHGIARNHLSLYTVRDRSVFSYQRLSVTVAGRRVSVDGLRISGVDYIPFRASANAVGASYVYDSRAKTSVMSMAGLTVSATDGNYAVMANDRPLFSMTPTVIMSDGRMYIPVSAFAKALGLSASVDGSRVTLGGEVKPLSYASRYYREDEVFWLARIIHAESSGEPLIGKIAVGNVVLNRVRSSQYPNTIYGVIFDRKYGVQFSPILNGAIYNTPAYDSYLAAKICLEGFDLSGGALFFLRPELSSSSWIPDSREYAFSVGKHDFYK